MFVLSSVKAAVPVDVNCGAEASMLRFKAADAVEVLPARSFAVAVIA